MPRSDRLTSEDPVTSLIERANRTVARVPDQATVAVLFVEIERLPLRDFVRFDWQARSPLSGLQWGAVGKLRRSTLRGARKPLWQTLALVSGDGHERERAIKAAPFTSLTTKLLVLRCVDWVGPVRDAALARLDDCPHDLLVAALPLAEQMAAERARGEILNALIDARLSDDDLRGACEAADPRTRRVAWQRLAARQAASADELRDVAARDNDVMVRAVADRSLDHLPDKQKRALAAVLVDDRVGWIAVPALAALVALDGAPPIVDALTARTGALRRAARDWASIRGVDARSIYLGRLAADPGDTVSLMALAEMSDPRDLDVFLVMLADDRSRVRAAGLRGLARVDQSAGRRAAVQALRHNPTGRITWAAADVLREGAPNGTEIDVLSEIAVDTTRTPGQRFRVLALLRPARWTHMSVLLEARDAADDERVRRRLDLEVRTWVWRSGRISRGPRIAVRARIERHLPTLHADVRREVEFVLRTSA